ncbi:MAG: TonB family protein [Lacibacter sp.]
MKTNLTLLLLLGLFMETFGQESNKDYLDEFGFPTIEISNAKSYRTISKHPAEPNKLIVKEYYLNDTSKQTCIFSDKEMYTKDGIFTSFYPNGRKSEEGFYTGNSKVGKWIKWYKNGQIQEESIWDNSKDYTQRQRVDNFWDSLGNKLATNGNGEYILDEEYPPIHAKGAIKNGLKTGKWTGFFENGNIAFEEDYKNNKLIKGTSYDSLGQKYKYDKEFDFNMMNFYEFIGQNLRYPEEAQRKGVEGKVIIQILFNTDGKIIKSRIVKGIGSGCDEEVLRVVSNYNGNWDGGKKRGQVIKMNKPQSRYFPITFKLGQ